MSCLIFNGRLVDIRQYKGNVKLSQDLSKHLPQRLNVGPILVLADNPRVFLSVVRRHLSRIAVRAEYYRCQTMDKRKRASLARLLLRLHTSRFSAKPHGDMQLTDAFFIAPEYLTPSLIAGAKTVYLTTQLMPKQFSCVLSSLDPKSLLVIYDSWPDYYHELISEHWGTQPV